MVKHNQFFFALMLLASQAFAKWNMPKGVTPISHEIYHLHMIIFYICLAIALGVFATMFYIMLKHRRSIGAKAANFHHNTWVEVIWTIIPTLILAIMAVPASKVLIAMEDDSKAEINIKITGHQWNWEYSYLDEGIHFTSSLRTPKAQIDGKAPKNRWYLLEVDHPLVVPIHKKIRFLLTSADVNHSWWVPELGIKKDAIAGLINTAWTRIDKPGVYRGQCTELCGMQHGFMPIVVIAKTELEYKRWVAKQTGRVFTSEGHMKNVQQKVKQKKKSGRLLSKTHLMSHGQTIYEKKCAVCHQTNGQGMPPAFPAIAGSSIATGPIQDHIHILLHGKRGTAMQSFSDQLSDEDIASVITYQRNSWGNDDKQTYGVHAGTIVQPGQVADARTQ